MGTCLLPAACPLEWSGSPSAYAPVAAEDQGQSAERSPLLPMEAGCSRDARASEAFRDELQLHHLRRVLLCEAAVW